MGWWAWSRAGNTERDGIGAPAPTNRKANGKDDRHDHQPGRYKGGRQDDLPLANQDPSPGRDEHQEERSEQFRKQPAPFEPGVVPLLTQTKLELEPVPDLAPSSSAGWAASAARARGPSTIRQSTYTGSVTVDEMASKSSRASW